MYPSHTLSVDFVQDRLPQDIAERGMERGMMCRVEPVGTTPSLQKCYPCPRYNLLPMSLVRTILKWWVV